MYGAAGISRARRCACDLEQRAAGRLRRLAMRRTRRNADEEHGNAGGCVARRDRLEPLLAGSARTTGSAWAPPAPASQSRCALVGGDARRIDDRVRREVDAQTGERLAARMRGERIVAVDRAACSSARDARGRIGGKAWKSSRSSGPRQKRSMPYSTRSRGSENEPASFGKSRQTRLKDDVAQVHRAIVAVEASDRAVVVGIRVDRNDDRAKAGRACGSIARTKNGQQRGVVPGTPPLRKRKRRSRHSPRRIEPGVDARIAQHQDVGPRIGVETLETARSPLRSCRCSRTDRGLRDRDRCETRERRRAQRSQTRPQREERPSSLRARVKSMAAPQRPLCESGLKPLGWLQSQQSVAGSKSPRSAGRADHHNGDARHDHGDHRHDDRQRRASTRSAATSARRSTRSPGSRPATSSPASS